ncbi:ion transporter [Shimia biformata]|uniref:ion transporter n=1 Tax=Shimia biformata TaxID=1294299 RepID=UPI001950DA15|nr:ion transporter [Shimia biformata]
MRAQLEAFLDRDLTQRVILGVIIFNAMLLGLETSPSIMAAAGPLIVTLDTICLAIFVVEIVAKIYARGWRFFQSGWGLFDLIVVGVALIPSGSGISVLRTLRVLRVLRVVSVAPRLRRVVEGFISALPGMASVFLLMAMIFYVGAVMATKLFSDTFPQWFGDLGMSAYTLFQIMTLESWSMGIVRPVMEVHPFAWVFFVPFILITTFAVVNLVVGLIVNSMQDAHHEEDVIKTDNYRDEVLHRLEAMDARIAEIQKEVKK